VSPSIPSLFFFSLLPVYEVFSLDTENGIGNWCIGLSALLAFEILEITWILNIWQH